MIGFSDTGKSEGIGRLPVAMVLNQVFTIVSPASCTALVDNIVARGLLISAKTGRCARAWISTTHRFGNRNRSQTEQTRSWRMTWVVDMAG
jgi:hypothetical protein